MPRRKYWKKGKAHQSLEEKNEMRQIDRKEKDDLLTGNERKGLNFPKKAENGLNFPKKAENGLNFPKKADSVANMPCTDSVAKKPCTDSVAKKHCTETVAQIPCTETAAKHITDTIANHFANSVSETNSMTSSNNTGTKLLPDTLVNPNISLFKQIIVELKENISTSMQTDFDTVILESFPDVDAKSQSRVIEKL